MSAEPALAGLWAGRARSAAADLLGAAGEPVVLALSIRPGREVYACQAPGRRVVAKCFPDDARAAVCARALDLLGGAHGELVIPRCLGHRAGSGVVVQEFLEGQPVGPALQGRRGADVVRRAARAAARMHALPVALPQRLGREQAVASARAAVEALGDAGEPLARTAWRVARRELAQAPAAPSVPSHGDLGWAQLLDCDPAIGILDFDKACQAEPGLDIGNLVAQLLRSRGDAGAPLRDRLVSTYEAATGVCVADAADAYALLLLVRKLAWLAPARRGELRAAIELLLGGRDR